MSKGYLTAKQASQKLGISQSTLYAYVSRGLIRSEPDIEKRRRRYRAEDVDALLQRKTEKSSADKSLSGALNWGEPICESLLTLIDDGELYYRGRWVSQMLEHSSFEDVIELLWDGTGEQVQTALPPFLEEYWIDLDPMDRFMLVLPWASQQDERAFDLRPPAVRSAGIKILQCLFSSVCHLEKGENFAGALARAWCPGHRKELEAALILCADHELNVSAFTGRCVASAGATPYAVVSAGLAALSGFRHGGHTYSVEALFREAEMLSPTEAIHSYLRRGASVPGFGHPLYPNGDPRGRDLLACLDELPELARGLIDTAQSILGEKPNIDFGLVALSKQLKLPPGAPVALFALGRCVGWIAHALEQYGTERMIRPRARYVGPLPEGRES